MGLEETQSSCRHSMLIPWIFAIVSISLLSACFIASCLVTYHSSLRCGERPQLLSLAEHHMELTCIKESELKGGSWSCCPVGWKSFQFNCYLPFHDNKTWAESERNCSGMGAHLATISTEAEQDFVTKFLDRQVSYFLGLTDKNTEGHWRWVDKMPFNPQTALWHENEPNNFKEEDCVILVNAKNKWAWNDFPCSFERSRICKLAGIALN